MNPSEYTYNN